MNAVGVVPTHYLNCTAEEEAELLYTNAETIHEQVRRKSQLKRDSAIFFKDFVASLECKIILKEIRSLIQKGSFLQASDLCRQSIKLSLRGLHYFQTYDWTFLMSTITLGFIGWMLYVTLFIYSNYIAPSDALHLRTELSFVSQAVLTLSLFVGVSSKLFIEHAPAIYYAYVWFPIFFWCQVIAQYQTTSRVLVTLLQDPLTSIGYGVLAICLMVIFVFSFFQRSVLAVCVATIGLFTTYHTRSFVSLLVYGLMSIFPLLPTDYGDEILFVRIGCFCMIPITLLPMMVGRRHPHPSQRQKIVCCAQCTLSIVSFVQTCTTQTGTIGHVINWSVCGEFLRSSTPRKRN
jgi:GPI ethanolamine phosphate transferase 1